MLENNSFDLFRQFDVYQDLKIIRTYKSTFHKVKEFYLNTRVSEGIGDRLIYIPYDKVILIWDRIMG